MHGSWLQPPRFRVRTAFRCSCLEVLENGRKPGIGNGSGNYATMGINPEGLPAEGARIPPCTPGHRHWCLPLAAFAAPALATRTSSHVQPCRAGQTPQRAPHLLALHAEQSCGSLLAHRHTCMRRAVGRQSSAGSSAPSTCPASTLRQQALAAFGPQCRATLQLLGLRGRLPGHNDTNSIEPSQLAG